MSCGKGDTGDQQSTWFPVAECFRIGRKGDDAILRALEEAVEIIGKNTQLLLEYYAARAFLKGKALYDQSLTSPKIER